MKNWTHRLGRLGWLFFLLWAGSIGTAEAPPGRGIPPAIWDVLRPKDSQPSWFGPVSAQHGWKTYTWRALVRPPPGDSRLALTLVFRETSGGFARVIWQEPGKCITVCGNLYEQAADLHQRTLLLDRGTLNGPGQFIVESTGTDPVLQRVEFNWVEPLVLAAGWNSSANYYLAPSGKIFPTGDLQDGARHAPSDEERGAVMDAVLDAGPVKLEPQTSIRFLTPMAAQPSYGRLEAEVAGFKPGQEPRLWVNGQMLSGVAVESPGLDDPGYRLEAGGWGVQYGGWRKLWAFVPVGFLQNGQNQIDVQLADVSSAVTLKNLRLQVAFGQAPDNSQSAAPAPVSSVSLGPSLGLQAPCLPQLRTGLSSGGSVVGLRKE